MSEDSAMADAGGDSCEPPIGQQPETAVSPVPSASIDLTRVPWGALSAGALVEAIAATDDRVENHYLELKGPLLDLSSKPDQAKLAKFILGAANRMPDVAATAFEGYGVMVIGVSPGHVVGVPPIEPLEIDRAVRPFIGAALHWDLQRAPVPGSSNEVLLILVDPPKPGQPPFPCRKSGDGLRDGAIYVRPTGETREANADEIDQLQARARMSATPAADFGVAVVGEVVPLSLDGDGTLEEYIAAERSRLLSALPQPEPKPELTPEPDQTLRPSLTDVFQTREPSTSSLLADLAKPYNAIAEIQATWQRQQDEISKLTQSPLARRASSWSLAALDTEPESRTEAQYRAEIDRWEDTVREVWPEAIERLIGMRLRAVTVEVTNREETFFHDVQLVLHLEGAVRGLKARDYDATPALYKLRLPHPPRVWGPRPREFSASPTFATGTNSGYQPPAAPPSMTWNNTGSVTADFAIGTLRGASTYRCDDSSLILIVDDAVHAPVHGTWQITARDHNRVYKGEVTVGIGRPVDLTSDLRQMLELPSSERQVGK